MLRKASLVGVLVGVLAACGGSPERGPVWPKLHEREADGGESLEPRQASAVAAIENAEDERPAEAAPAAGAAGEADDGAAAAQPEAPSSEAPSSDDSEIFTTEEIVIEIED